MIAAACFLTAALLAYAAWLTMDRYDNFGAALLAILAIVLVVLGVQSL